MILIHLETKQKSHISPISSTQKKYSGTAMCYLEAQRVQSSCARYATQLGQMTKTRQKLDWKTREIDWLYLCLQQFDRF